VHLDLPIKFDDRVHNFIFVKPKELKEFKWVTVLILSKKLWSAGK
jgi:hypothetical protein